MKEYVTIAVYPETKKLLKHLAADQDLQLCEMVDVALKAYEESHAQQALTETAHGVSTEVA